MHAVLFANVPSGVSELDDGSYVYTFTLAHDESITFSDIPWYIRAEFQELDYTNEGYTTRVNGEEVLGGNLNMTEDCDVTYENEYIVVVPTGVANKNWLGMVLALSGALFGIWYVFRKKLSVKS